MPRLFTGLSIPRAAADRLMLLRGHIPGARWIDPDNYHITLRFVGDVSEVLADEFVARLEDLQVTPFEVQFKGVGSFGSKRPHIVYAMVVVTDALANLHRQHEKIARDVGLTPESRTFIPHVTLARMSGVHPYQIAPFLSDHAAFELPPFKVSRFHLYSAKPSTGGGPYVIEQSFPSVGEDDEADVE
jgi:2'-5' RNA ligase